MNKFLIRILVAILTFSISLFAVWVFFHKNVQPAQPVKPIETIPIPLAEKSDATNSAEPAPYEPFHIPRLKNTRLAFPGEALNDEKPTTGFEEGWLALYKTKKGYELRKARVKISLYHYEMVDQKGEKSGRRYTLADKSEPLFMIKSVPGINPGVIRAVHNSIGVEEEGEDGTIIDFRDTKTLDQNVHSSGLLDVGYSFSIRGTETKGGILDERGSVTLSKHSIQQTIYEQPLKPTNESEDSEAYKVWERENFESVQLLWAGDIDADGGLDLILDLGRYYPGGYENRYVLYISSHAREGEVVVPVADFKSYVVD